MIFNQADKVRPYIGFDKETGVLSIEGSSFPENVDVVYMPVLKWLNDLDFGNVPKFTLRVSLKYYNTATSKKLFELIQTINQAYADGFKVEILWEYISDDEDMFESGRYYSELIDVPFHFIEIPD
ncbi:MAG: DUF1987 domain-containing protein [Salinivirgaceae bacterium]|jgi:hypothetical protein|nr:DUF1987 domain-containing protein [Salinivirgaceae bacterium]